MEENKYPHALKQGTTLKNDVYIIEKVLGAGGFGITYLGTKKADTAFGDDQQVVVKELFLSVSDYNCTRNYTNNRTVVPQAKLIGNFEQFQNRFKNEALTLHKFRHLDGMVKVLDYFEENDTNYFTMEYIKAETLKDYVKEKGGLPVDEAINYIKQVGEVLTALHKENVMHRDIKPDNILIDANNKVYLIDFGIAKQYDETGIVTKITGMGTNRYAPPEQLAGIKDLISFAMDVFGLANTLYYFLTANDPQTSDEENIYGKKTVQDFCPDISSELNDAIEQGRIKRPQERTQTVEGFLDGLDVDIQDEKGFDEGDRGSDFLIDIESKNKRKLNFDNAKGHDSVFYLNYDYAIIPTPTIEQIKGLKNNQNKITLLGEFNFLNDKLEISYGYKFSPLPFKTTKWEITDSIVTIITNIIFQIELSNEWLDDSTLLEFEIEFRNTLYQGAKIFLSGELKNFNTIPDYWTDTNKCIKIGLDDYKIIKQNKGAFSNSSVAVLNSVQQDMVNSGIYSYETLLDKYRWLVLSKSGKYFIKSITKETELYITETFEKQYYRYFDIRYNRQSNNFYIITEWFDGTRITDYSEFLTKDRGIFKKVIISLINQLEFLHSLGLVHNDLKPENILFNKNTKEVRLIDFGTANNIGVTFDEFTPRYSAPELLFSKIQRISNITNDIYSIGCVLFEITNKEKPFPTANSLDELKEIKNKKFDIYGIGKKNHSNLFFKIIKKATNKHATKRYQSFKELKEDLLKINETDEKTIIRNEKTRIYNKDENTLYKGTKSDELLIDCPFCKKRNTINFNHKVNTSVNYKCAHCGKNDHIPEGWLKKAVLTDDNFYVLPNSQPYFDRFGDDNSQSESKHKKNNDTYGSNSKSATPKKETNYKIDLLTEKLTNNGFIDFNFSEGSYIRLKTDSVNHYKKNGELLAKINFENLHVFVNPGEVIFRDKFTYKTRMFKRSIGEIIITINSLLDYRLFIWFFNNLTNYDL